jgi:hypothetical protein
LSIRVAKRDWYRTVGFTTDLEAQGAEATPDVDFEISDVSGQISGMERPVVFVVFVRDGLLSWLEGTSMDEEWPDSISEFALGYIYEPRRLRIPKVTAS